jgi:hypothetical protein
MPANAEVELWATQQVAFATLNDVRNVERLRQMLEALAQAPSPCVAAVYSDAAALQAAYDFLENGRVRPPALALGFATATAQSLAGRRRVFVGVDASSLSLEDRAGRKGLGPIGTRREGGRGLKFFEALAIGEDGVPLGVLGVALWTRAERRARRPHDQRPLAQKESRYWNELRAQARTVCRRVCPDVELCFLLDRDADDWAVFEDAVRAALASGGREHVIVRAAQDRRVAEGHHDVNAPPMQPPLEHLQDLLRWQPSQPRFTLSVSASPTRTAREAVMEVAFAPVTIDLLCVPGGGHLAAPLWVVHTRECSPVRAGAPPLEWTLWTTIPVRSFADAARICHAYAHRWRCEDLHKTVKGGVLELERTQLQSVGAIERWFLLHLVVATRILRLTYLARAAPDAPATAVLTPLELEALAGERAKHGRTTPKPLTVGQLLPMLASLGGYTGGARRQPGPKVIGRALERLAVLAEGMQLRDALEKRRRKQTAN